MNAQNQVAQYDWGTAIQDSCSKFDESPLAFYEEQVFATQLLMNNSYALKCAKENPMSLKLAMYNLAAIGLTLNPAQGLAYLVPRRINRNEKPRICVDISYRGLIAIGVDIGAILWAKSELVFEHDKFTYRGPAKEPDMIVADPFDEEKRGALRGGYCIAELPNGTHLVELMSLKEMNKIRDRSEAYKNGVGPWIDWESEMRKKALIKRAYKWWPQAHANPRLSTAVKVLNEEAGEGIVFDNNGTVVPIKTVESELPPAPPADQVEPKVRTWIANMVSRAVETGAFEACKEVMEQRIQNVMELSFAFSELKQAQQKQPVAKTS
tara:strand:+ start:11159 stop:12127 length:969 start_codon:yes stop_codon:yes gene_type:complete